MSFWLEQGHEAWRSPNFRALAPGDDSESRQFELGGFGNIQSTQLSLHGGFVSGQASTAGPSNLVNLMNPEPRGEDSNVHQVFRRDHSDLPPPVLASQGPQVSRTDERLARDIATPRRRRMQPPSEEQWEMNKTYIEHLYMVQKLPLPVTMQMMKDNHTFEATDKMYKDRFKMWQWSKYLPRDKAAWMLWKANQRRDRDTVFTYGNQDWGQERIRETCGRMPNHQAILETQQLDKPTPDGITYRTPVTVVETPRGPKTPQNANSPAVWTPRPSLSDNSLDGRALRLDWRHMSLKDLDSLLSDAVRTDARHEIDKAESKFLDAVAGFKHLLSPTHPKCIRAAYLLASFYGNHEMMDRADDVLNWLTARHVDRWGHHDKRTLLHFLRVAEMLQLWSRQEHAKVILYKLLHDWEDIDDENSLEIPSIGGHIISELDELDDDAMDLICEDIQDPSEVNIKLQAVDLWLSNGNYRRLGQLLARLINQCDKHPDILSTESIQARCSLAQLHIQADRGEEAKSVLKEAWKFLVKLMKKDRTWTNAVSDLCLRLGFLHLQNKDERLCRKILE